MTSPGLGLCSEASLRLSDLQSPCRWSLGHSAAGVPQMLHLLWAVPGTLSRSVTVLLLLSLPRFSWAMGDVALRLRLKGQCAVPKIPATSLRAYRLLSLSGTVRQVSSAAPHQNVLRYPSRNLKRQNLTFPLRKGLSRRSAYSHYVYCLGI